MRRCLRFPRRLGHVTVLVACDLSLLKLRPPPILVAMRLVLPVPGDFDFRNAICSHGFFVLAPNRWDPARQTLRTVVTIDDTLAVAVTIRESSTCKRRSVVVTASDSVTAAQRSFITAGVRRLLRLDESFADFHERCRGSASHQSAASSRFGRLLRSTTLFEDLVKVICTCNVTWRQTVAMVNNIVSHWGVPTSDGLGRGFPTASILACVPADELRTAGRVGYRAAFLHRLAQDVIEETLDLASIDAFAGPTPELHHRLRKIAGVGDYAAAHICMLLGRYDRLAIDTETMRHLKLHHPRRKWTPAAVERHYRPWHPYQFLAYWFELWQDYERRHGQASAWEPTDQGSRITVTASKSMLSRNQE